MMPGNKLIGMNTASSEKLEAVTAEITSDAPLMVDSRNPRPILR